MDELKHIYNPNLHPTVEVSEQYRQHLSWWPLSSVRERAHILSVADTILANLHKAHLQNGDLGFPRKHTPGWKSRNRQMDYLIHAGLVQQDTGSFHLSTGQGQVTTVWSTGLIPVFQKVEEALATQGGGPPQYWQRDIPIEETIQLRKPDRDHPQCRFDLGNERRWVMDYNQAVRCAEIVYWPVTGHPRRLDCQVHRVFNHRWDRGGRFWGAEHQNLSGGSDARKLITIDGDPVVELDYSGFHIRMAYHLLNLEYRGDPYVLYPDSSDNLREVGKIVNIIALNTKTRTGAVRAIHKKLREENITLPPGLTVDGLIARFLEIHHPIKSFFFSDRALEFQHYDSYIAKGIMDHFLSKGIICLSVHDSFLVPRLYRAELGNVMRVKYAELILGREPEIH